ncbi:MAG: hypothetical protein KDB03_15620 [Planctomycetales bacterium]|nr:hypothetical protein [Planctomycetales bacterium]
MKIVIVLLMYLLLRPTLFGQVTSEATALAAEALLRAQEVTANSPSGSMKFEAILFSKDQQGETHTNNFTGKVQWDYPNIRWDYTEAQDSFEGRMFILLENDEEICKIDLGLGNAYRSPDKTFSYPDVLRFAPWQGWFEAAQGVSFEQILDFDRKTVGEPVASADNEGGDLVFRAASEKPGEGMRFRFSSTYLPLLIKNVSGDFTGERTITWVNIDGRSYPSSLEYFQGTGTGKPGRATIKFSEHQPTHSLQKADFFFKTVDRKSLKKIFTLRLGKEPSVVVLKGGVTREEKLKELGKVAKEKGFLTEQN